ncbi:MAG: D-alanine--D-alanine ligase [Acidobacteria bacterium]|nr:D-alanine--D-alanine ligase [Acidobacteriota bacterium]
MKPLRVGIIYGGRSGEHEVSLASAASIAQHLDATRYQVVPIRIEKSGQWLLNCPVPRVLTSAPGAGVTDPPTSADPLTSIEPSAAVSAGELDVVFPVLHGPYGEDGTVQGLLELINVPYVGAGVLGSAAGMDKAVMKVLFAASGLPIVPHLTVLHPRWRERADAIAEQAADELRFPMFVKPANLGSSVGISKARSRTEFLSAMELALQFDRKVVIEAAVPNPREIECAVLGNDDPEASTPGEIVVTRDFYDYEAKYADGASQLIVPAPITNAQADEIRRMAIAAFQSVDGAGMSRVDFLMAGDTNRIFLNEVNTIPGFTTTSVYPKLWEASGVTYPELLDRLIVLALDRHADKQRLRTSLT